MISWVLLTFNRAEIVRKSITHNLNNCGVNFKEFEIIHIDNGSADGVDKIVKEFLNPEIIVKYEENQGVAKGYNAGMALARGDWIVITGCDMLMPNNWMSIFRDYLDKVPGIACMYSRPHMTSQKVTVNGLEVMPCLPIDRRMMSKKLQRKIGYFPEDMGLYGYDDCVYAERALKICTREGVLPYMIPDQVPIHLGTEAVMPFDGKDSKEYHDFKKREVEDPKKQERINWYRSAGYPKVMPY